MHPNMINTGNIGPRLVIILPGAHKLLVLIVQLCRVLRFGFRVLRLKLLLGNDVRHSELFSIRARVDRSVKADCILYQSCNGTSELPCAPMVMSPQTSAASEELLRIKQCIMRQ